MPWHSRPCSLTFLTDARSFTLHITAYSLVLVRIPSLLERVALVQEENLAVFLYDTTPLNTGGTEEFLGAGNFRVSPETVGTVEILDEIDYPTFRKQQASKSHHHRYRQNLYYETTVAITPSGTWKVAVVPLDDTYDPYVIYVGFGGAMIFTAGLCLALGYCSHMRRDARWHELRVASETEKAALIVRNAQQTAQAERELNDFLAHEVRNPLAAAISASSFVLMAVGGDSSTSSTAVVDANTDAAPRNNEIDLKGVREDMNVINSSLQYINDLLRNMLDMHKVSSKQLRITLAPASLKQDIFEPVATMLYQKKYSFAVQVDCPDSIIASVDRIRLKQIVLNLVNNSCKFVQQGFVRMGAYVDPEDGHVRVFVEDSGPGIPSEKRDKLFEKFQSSLDTLCQGTGIGLNLCRDLAELMNGSIALDDSFHSGIDGCPGTRFVIDLNTRPLGMTTTPEHTHDDESKSKKAERSGPRLPHDLQVLFADDDATLRKLFRRSLQRVAPSWNIQEASNGETALRLIETNKFDLIFVDQYMASIQKQMLGTETTRVLRSKGYRGIICGLSANSLEDAFLSAGADSFMFKPFPCQAGELEKEMARVLHRGASKEPDL